MFRIENYGAVQVFLLPSNCAQFPTFFCAPPKNAHKLIMFFMINHGVIKNSNIISLSVQTPSFFFIKFFLWFRKRNSWKYIKEFFTFLLYFFFKVKVNFPWQNKKNCTRHDLRIGFVSRRKAWFFFLLLGNMYRFFYGSSFGVA